MRRADRRDEVDDREGSATTRRAAEASRARRATLATRAGAARRTLETAAMMCAFVRE
jgi:hypothetical protein